MVLAMRSARFIQVLSVALVLSMLLGGLPATLFLAPVLADAGGRDDSRGLLPSDESFQSTSYSAFDSDNNSKRDAITARYTVRTTAATEQVSVLIKAEDSEGSIVKIHYDNFTAFLVGNQQREWTFYAYYTGRYRLTLTLYDSQKRQEDTDASGFYSLDTGTVKRWITISTKGLDLDKDTFNDDVEVHVTNWTDKDVSGAQVWINGSSVGKTNSTGRIIGKNYPAGWINIDVFWKDLHNSTAWQSQGDGTAQTGLRVRAEVFDADGDSLEDEVTITVTNQLGLPVRGATVTFNRTDQGTTDISGELTVFNVKRGFWIVNVTKLNQFGSTTFFSEGQGAGTDVDEYFFDIEQEVVDHDGDDRMNDLEMRFDVDVDPPVESTVTVWANLSFWGNGTAAHNVSTTFTVNGTKSEWNTLLVPNITYGMYMLFVTLLDSDDNQEDFYFSIVRLTRPSNHVNVETGVYNDDDTGGMNDALFRTLRVDQVEPNITLTLFNETGVQVRTGKTNEDGRRWFRNLATGIFNWTAKDTDGRLVEKGRIVIGARVQVNTDLLDADFDGYYDDFRVEAYNNIGRGVSTVTVTVWAPNGTEVTSNLTLGGQLQAMNLTKGTYEFNATYLGDELANGTFYSYGNKEERFTIVVHPAARDLDGDGRYDDVNVTVLDTDDSPMEFAKVYVDGVYKTLTDLNGYADLKDLGWGIHTVEAHYSGEVAKAQFFSEGKTTDKPTWAVLVAVHDEDRLDEMMDVGSTNSSLLLYYAETTQARPRGAHLWIVLKGTTQDIEMSRLGLKAAAEHDLEDDGVLDAIVRKGLGHFSAQRTAFQILMGSNFGQEDPFWLEREMADITTDMGSRLGLMGYDTRPFFSCFAYEIRSVADYAIGFDDYRGFPLKAVSQRVTGTPSTTVAELGEHAVDRAIASGGTEMLLLEMAKMAAYATRLNTLMAELEGSYPDEGWNIQDARNESGFVEYSELAVTMSHFLTNLVTATSDTEIISYSNALAAAVSNLQVKVTDSQYGVQLIFPNSTERWDDYNRAFINSSELADDTRWNEFLDEFWRFREYGIEVHATAFDKEGSGRDNDVRVYVNDTYGRAIAGARVHIDLVYEGTTNATGYLEAFNYTRGVHIVNVTWGDYEDETSFTSEGTIVPNVAPTVTITDPEEDDEVNGTYDVRGTADDSDGAIVRVEVRFNGGNWQTALGRNNWRFEWDTTQVADGDWLIEARAFDGDLWSTIAKVNVTVYNPVVYADILLVDDDGGQAYEVWYVQALNTYGAPYDVIEVADGENGPDAERLGHAKVVIWLTGEESESTLRSADRAALSSFLDGGGALFLTGQDIGRDLTSEGSVTSAFMRDYLKADFVADNANIYDLIAVANEEISEGINISIEGGTGAPNQNYPSEIQPRPGASVVFFYNATAEAAVKFGGATFRTVYFAFGFEGIADRGDRNRVMGNVIDWLLSNQTTGDNQPPVVNAGNDVVTMVGEVAIFRGHATDPDGLVSLFEWDFDGDGTYDWSNRSTGVAQWTFDTAGNYTAKFRATDNIGDFATAEVSVEVRPRPANVPPVADAGDDVTVEQGDPVEFVMAGYDLDGQIVLYEWDYEDDGEFDEASLTAVTTHHVYFDPGVYTAVLRVTDDEGATGTDARTVTVKEKVQNQPPVADAGPDIRAQVGTEVTLVGTGTDPDGHIVTYKWDFDGDNEYDWESTTTGTATHTYTAVGFYLARFLVIDDNNTAATDTANINITPVHVNLKPTADAGPDDIQQAVQGEPFEFHGTGTDPDGFIALYEWDFDGDGTWDWSDTQERTVSHTYEETGLFIARFRVTDNEGDTALDVVRVQVTSSTTSNEPPTADAGGPYTGVSGQSVTLTGTGTDPDGSVVSYEWDFEGDGTIDHYSPSSGTVTKVYQLSGVYNAVLYVTDDGGKVATDVAEVRIERANQQPTVRITDPVSGQAITGYYVVRGTATDDTGISKVEVRVDDGTWVKATGTMVWSYDMDTSTLTPGVHLVKARATDVNGEASLVVEVQFTVDEPEVEGEDTTPWYYGTTLWAGVLLLIVLLVVGMMAFMRYRDRDR